MFLVQLNYLEVNVNSSSIIVSSSTLFLNEFSNVDSEAVYALGRGDCSLSTCWPG